MGFFDIFKKKKEEKETLQTVPTKKESNLILAMPLFKNGSYSIDAIVEDLKSYWGLEVSDFQGDDETTVLAIEGEKVAIARIPVPIPAKEFENMFQCSYLWKDAEKEVPEHTEHAIVTILSSDNSTLDRWKLLTKILSSVFRTSPNAIGHYQGSQTLLIHRDLYIDMAEMLHDDELPVLLWICIVLSQNNLYTWGLKSFDKKEIEIIDSSLSNEELYYDFVQPILGYIIGYDVTLKDGETIGFTEEQKIKITQSKGVFLDEETLKLEI